jgi:hypothetical protein
MQQIRRGRMLRTGENDESRLRIGEPDLIEPLVATAL